MDHLVTQLIGLLPIVIPLIIVGIVIARAAYETRENHETICSLLRIKPEDRHMVRVTYGPGLPCTLGYAHTIRIHVPDKLIPHIVTPEDAVKMGVTLMRSLDMDDAQSSKHRTRYRNWTLTR